MDRASPHAYVVSLQSQLEQKTEEVIRLRRAIVQYRCTTEQVTAKCEKQREELKQERLATQRAKAELERARQWPADNQFDNSTVDSGLSSVHSSDDVLLSLLARQKAVDVDYQAAIRMLEERCDLLAQQCEVSKKERADALDAQEKLTRQCFDVCRENDALRKVVDDQAPRIAELEKENGSLRERLECAKQEMIKAQEKRDWALEAHSQALRECSEARHTCEQMRMARDQALGKQMYIMKELDMLKAEMGVISPEPRPVSCSWHVPHARVEEFIAAMDEWIEKEGAYRRHHQLNGCDSAFGSHTVGTNKTEEEQRTDLDLATRLSFSYKEKTLKDAKEHALLGDQNTGHSYVIEVGGDADIVSGIEWETWPTVAAVRCQTADVSLSVGDVITEVNGICTRNASCQTLMQLLESQGLDCSLTVRRHCCNVPSSLLQLRRNLQLMAQNLQRLDLAPCDSWALGRTCAASDCKVPAAAISQRDSPSSSIDSTRNLLPSSASPVNAGHRQAAKISTSVVSKGSVSGVIETEQGYEMPFENAESKSSIWTAATVPGMQRKRSRISTELRNELRRYKLNNRKLSVDVSVGSNEPQLIAETKTGKESYVWRSSRTDLQSKFVDDSRSSRPVGSATKYLSWSVPSSHELQLRHLSDLSPTIGRSMTSCGLHDLLEWSASASHYSLTGGSGSSLVMSDGHKRRVQGQSSRYEPSDVETVLKPGLLLRTECQTREVVIEKCGGTLGFLIQGGNRTGIFVSELRPGISHSNGGVQPGDEILEVGGKCIDGFTREEAAELLRNVHSNVRLVVRHNSNKFLQLPRHCDSMYVRCTVSYTTSHPAEMSFRKGQILHVVDTVVNHPPNSWRAVKVSTGGRTGPSKAIPNTKRSLEQGRGQKMYDRIEMRVV